MSLLEFLTLWSKYCDDDGMSYPLPSNWRVMVDVLTEAGIGEEQWEHVVEMADSKGIAAGSKFRHAVNTAWEILAEERGLRTEGAKPFLVDQARAERKRAAEEEKALRRRKEAEERRKKDERAWPDFLKSLEGVPVVMTSTGTVHLADGCRFGRSGLPIPGTTVDDTYCGFCFPKHPPRYLAYQHERNGL